MSQAELDGYRTQLAQVEETLRADPTHAPSLQLRVKLQELVEKGVHPVNLEYVSEYVAPVLKRGWAREPSMRPTAKELCEVMQHELAVVKDFERGCRRHTDPSHILFASTRDEEEEEEKEKESEVISPRRNTAEAYRALAGSDSEPDLHDS